MRLSKNQKRLGISLLAAGLLTFLAPTLSRWFVGGTARSGTGATTEARAGGFVLDAALFPDAPRDRGNVLRVRIRDMEGKPVAAAQVGIDARMPAMGAMPEMRSPARVEEEAAGLYAGAFDLPMGGTWTLRVQVATEDRSAEARFRLTLGVRGLTFVSAEGGAASVLASLPPCTLDERAAGRLRQAFDIYENVRDLLARGLLEGLAAQAAALETSLLSAIEEGSRTPPEIVPCLNGAARIARDLAGSRGLEEARSSFGELSRYLVGLAAADPNLQAGWRIFECPMVKGFPKWFQRSDRIENPYMGESMPTCGSPTDWSVPAPKAEASADAGASGFYTCSMHPSVRQDRAGICPLCGMQLVEVTKQEAETGTFLVDPVRRQRIGVRIARVEERRVTLTVRAVGVVEADETRLFDVNVRVGGWIQKLEAAETGQRIEEGQVLFTLYSPELYAAQLEHLTAVNAGARGPTEERTALARASRQRLLLLGMSEAQVEDLEKRGEAREQIAFLAPSGGYLLEKAVVKGARVNSGTRLFRIADLDRLWVNAEVYESDLLHVKAEQEVLVQLPFAPGRSFSGKVDYVYPTFESATRTGRVRVVLENADLVLKPGMYANVAILVDLGRRLVVPESAVVYTGTRRLVFLDLGEGRLMPREIRTGVRTEGEYEVLDGLRPGDRVVSSGNFLVAAESRIRSATQYWEPSDANR